MSGPNDQAGSVQPGLTTGTFGGNVATLVNRFRGATTGASTSTAMDILLISPPENERGTANPLSIAAYAANYRELAYRARTAFLDLQMEFGDQTTPTTYAATGDVPLFENVASAIHPDGTTGGRLIAASVLKTVKPY
jgi:hypothetical protein